MFQKFDDTLTLGFLGLFHHIILGFVFLQSGNAGLESRLELGTHDRKGRHWLGSQWLIVLDS